MVSKISIKSSVYKDSEEVSFSEPLSTRKLAVYLLLLDFSGLLFFFASLNIFLYHNTDWLAIVSLDFWLLTLSVILVYYIFDLYKPDLSLSEIHTPGRVLMAAFLASLLGFLGVYIFNPAFQVAEYSKFTVFGSMFLFLFWGSFTRWRMAKHVQTHSRQMKWLVLADSECFEPFFNEFMRHGGLGSLIVLAPADENFTLPQSTIAKEKCQYSGSYQSLQKITIPSISGVILVTRRQLKNDVIETLMKFRFMGIRIFTITDFYEKYWQKLPIYHLRSGWLTFSSGFYLLHNRVGLRFKRLFDVVLALGLLFFTLPLQLLVMLLIKFDSEGPVFYSQVRTGELGREFLVHKFRSMKANAESNGAQWAIKKDPRVTPLGRFLRKTRLDELPQLWNVFIGDMSFIGPRPERPIFNKALEKVIPFYDLRHVVRPGLTGWAQVMFSYGASVEDAREKLQYDLYYIKNYSFILDVAIVLKTFRVMLFGSGQ